MKKILLIVAIAFLASFAGISQGKQYQVYGVAFYNLENLFDTINNNGKYDLEFSPEGPRQWNSEKYHSKLKNMSYAISQMTTSTTPMGPAIIGVSEIENRSVLDDLVKEESIRKWHLQVVHHDSPDRRGVDVGLLYNPRMFRVLNVTNTTLTVEGKPEFRTRDQMCVTGMLGGDKVSIIVNHWPSRLGGQEQSSFLREAAARLSKHLADSVLAVDPNQGVIIMGDLNDDPMDKSVAKEIGAVRDKKDATAAGGFYNPWWAMLDKGIGTLAYRGQWNLFDQIIVTGNLVGKDRSTLKYVKSEIFNRDFLKQQEGKYKGYPLRTHAGGVYMNGYSDHFPTIIYLAKEVK
ncbi:MAG: endonuclease/exonuclease/phosphatase family protein [Muribaculaceae bacterium]